MEAEEVLILLLLLLVLLARGRRGERRGGRLRRMMPLAALAMLCWRPARLPAVPRMTACAWASAGAGLQAHGAHAYSRCGGRRGAAWDAVAHTRRACARNRWRLTHRPASSSARAGIPCSERPPWLHTRRTAAPLVAPLPSHCVLRSSSTTAARASREWEAKTTARCGLNARILTHRQPLSRARRALRTHLLTHSKQDGQEEGAAVRPYHAGGGSGSRAMRRGPRAALNAEPQGAAAAAPRDPARRKAAAPGAGRLPRAGGVPGDAVKDGRACCRGAARSARRQVSR